MKTGLILEGGAMRGIYSAGVIDALMEHDIHFDTIIGVSAGALFGMNYKSKQKGRVLRYNTRFANNKNYMGFYSFLTTGNIMNEQFCFHDIVYKLDPVDFKTYKENPVDFYCVVTNMKTGKAEYKLLDNLENHDQLEYLRASGSMPFVSHPVKVKNELYLDGGIADSIPINKMLDMDVDRIVVVLTRPLGYRKKHKTTLLNRKYYKNYPEFVDTLNHRYLDYNLSLDIVSHMEKKKEIFVIRPSRLIKIKRLEKDVDVIKSMYDLGFDDMEDKIDDLKQFLRNI